MKIKAKLSSLFLVLCLTFSFVIPVSANTTYSKVDSIQQNSFTVQSYKDFIKSKSKIRNDKMKISNSSEEDNFLEDFNNLTEDEQELFVSYINDSDTMLKILESLSDEQAYISLENGDIVVSNDESFKDTKSSIGTMAALQSRIATGTKTVTILGLNVFKYAGEIRYTHDGSSIKEILHANCWISVNWFPLVDFKWSDSSTYGVGSKSAHHIEYCTWSFVHESLGLTYGTHQVEIYGTVYNTTYFDALTI